MDGKAGVHQIMLRVAVFRQDEVYRQLRTGLHQQVAIKCTGRRNFHTAFRSGFIEHQFRSIRAEQQLTARQVETRRFRRAVKAEGFQVVSLRAVFRQIDLYF
ncbi:hypothetical protein DWU89_15390 [Parabacteroides acidifaciens]|uniref:Uncharacterized protein n=1 Tax=Parabacteroides acidifaciens TaxID=2290935 RepID=A0A3D8HB59_9BACT|nr:hypothetical protein DWU89_15390 [Parabacteroides acidifaciens]